MRLLGKTALVLGLAGTMAVGSMTASEARNGRNAAIAAGIGGFVAGAAIGAAANSGYYYGGYGYDSYAYSPGYSVGYDSYAYQPAPVYRAPSYYGPVGPYEISGYHNGYDYGSGGYNTNYTGPWQERRLQGREW